MKALALNPADRYPQAGAFARALDGWLRREPTTSPFRRALAGVSAVGLAATVGLVSYRARDWRGGPSIGTALMVAPPSPKADVAVQTRTALKPCTR